MGGLTARALRSADGLRAAAAAGVTDSMPRAAIASLHARVDGVGPGVLDDPALTQVWGPRYSVYVVAADDVAPFTLGRLPTDRRGLERARGIAGRLADLCGDGEPIPMGDAGHALGIHPNALRYASATGTVRIRWDGAHQPTVRVVEPPDVDPGDARRELVRRHLHHLGPATPDASSRWAGVRPRQVLETFEELGDELLRVRTPIGDGWILADDVASFTAPDTAAGDGIDLDHVRLLPSGDAYWLLWDEARELLVGSAARRDELWTSRVWPGAVLVAGEIVGTWRRSQATATVSPWRRLTAVERGAIEHEAASLPLPDLTTPVRVTWE